jgi:hypothetical protein
MCLVILIHNIFIYNYFLHQKLTTINSLLVISSPPQRKNESRIEIATMDIFSHIPVIQFTESS